MSLGKKLGSILIATVVIVVVSCLSLVYFKSYNMIISQSEEKVANMIKTFDSASGNVENKENDKGINEAYQNSLKSLKSNMDELDEFTIYKLGDDSKAVASSDESKLGKKTDPEDEEAARSNKTVVIVNTEEGKKIVDVTAPLHSDGKITYVAGVKFVIEDEIELMDKLLFEIIMIGVSAIVVIILIMMLLGKIGLKDTSKQLHQLMLISKEVSEGNLSVRAEIEGKGDIGILASNFNSMIDKMKGLIEKAKGIGDKVEEVSKEIVLSSNQSALASEQIAGTTQELSRTASEQAILVEQGRNRVENIMTGLEQISKISSNSFELTIKASKAVEDGVKSIEYQKIKMQDNKEAVDNLNAVVLALSKQSNEIGSIISVIDGIAEQTNLLALNAAIEAVRAGEQGKGFSVVAEEVRKLAEESQKSTEKITDMIIQVQNNLKNASTEMKRSEEAVSEQQQALIDTINKFEEISHSVTDVTSKIKQVAESTGEINSETKLMGESIYNLSKQAEANADSTEQVSASTEEQAAIAKEIVVSAENLSVVAKNLKDSLDKFKC